jgi:acetyl esterase/lipase
MLRWLLFLLALVLTAAAVLTCVKAPTLTTWMVAILVDEYGHWLALLALAILVTTVMVKPAGPVRWLTVASCVMALPLLLKPTFQAWKISWSLPARLEAVFGPAQLDHPAFDLRRLFAVSLASKIRPSVEVYTRAGKPDAQSLDFYRAVNRNKRPAPCVIIVHGGGWDNGDRKELPALDSYLARRGYAVATISYRLAPKYPWPAQREDILDAIAYLKKRASALNIDPTQFVLFGRSAGGNLAEAVGYSVQDPAIKGVVAFYAPADLHFAWAYAKEDDILNSFLLLKQFLGGTPDSVGKAYDETSPYLFVNKSTPPTLLVHGELDSLVWHKQSERLDARLEENSVPHVFVSLPWATHAFDYNLNGPGGQIALYSLENFLAGVTK